MKKISRLSLIILLGICVACQGIEIPPSATSTSPVSTATSSTIAFYSHRDGNLEIYLMDADGSEQRRVTSNEYDDDSPVLSPDWHPTIAKRGPTLHASRWAADNEN
jgi:hypothetical protein